MAIEKLSAEKFTTWEWNFGYSPKYRFQNLITIDGKFLKIEIRIEKGIISEIGIEGEYFSPGVALQLSKSMQKQKTYF